MPRAGRACRRPPRSRPGAPAAFDIGEPVSKRSACEVPVLLTIGHVLADQEIVDLQGPTRVPGGSRPTDRYHALLLSPVEQRRGVDANSVGVITKRLMEHRQLADRTLDQLGAFGIMPGIDVRLERHEERSACSPVTWPNGRRTAPRAVSFRRCAAATTARQGQARSRRT